MKKILFTLFLFLTFCIPSFAESVFVPDITTEQAKKAIINYIVSNGWLLKNETNYTLHFEKAERAHDSILYEREKLEYERLSEIKRRSAERMEDGLLKRMRMNDAQSYLTKTPEWYNSYTISNLQFVFTESNGVTVSTSTSTQEIKDMIKTVFKGYYSYNIEYKIPLLKNQVLISDTPQTNYTDMNRAGEKKKITKINDKNVKDYKKEEIKKLLEECYQEQIKLESEDGKIYNIRRTFIEPTYKRYL